MTACEFGSSEWVEAVNAQQFSVQVFKSNLKRSAIKGKNRLGVYDKLLELVDDPRFVIRGREPGVKWEGEQLYHNCAIVQRLFKELSDVYGIPAPIQYIVARNHDGEVGYYAIVNRIEAAAIDARARDLLVVVFETLLTYYEHKMRAREDCLVELFHDQFVYGSLEADPEPRWYLIDADPIFSKSRSFLKLLLGPTNERFEEIEALCGRKLPDLRERHRQFRRQLRGR